MKGWKGNMQSGRDLTLATCKSVTNERRCRSDTEQLHREREINILTIARAALARVHHAISFSPAEAAYGRCACARSLCLCHPQTSSQTCCAVRQVVAGTETILGQAHRLTRTHTHTRTQTNMCLDLRTLSQSTLTASRAVNELKAV